MARVAVILACVLFLTGLCAVFSPAQYSAGDAIVVGLFGEFYRVTRQGSVSSASPRLNVPVEPLMVAPDNRSIWFLGQHPQPPHDHYLYRFAYDGSITSVLKNPPVRAAGGTDVTGHGHLIIGGGTTILKGTISSGFTTLLAGSPLQGIRGGCIDVGTGDYIALEDRRILRISLQGKPTVTSVASLSGIAPPVPHVHFDPESGDLVGVWNWAAIHRITLGPSASVTTLFHQPSWFVPVGLDRDPRDGRFVVLSLASNQPGLKPAVFRFDARSRAITTLAMVPTPVPRPPGPPEQGPLIAGSRHLWPGSEARPGRPYRLMVSSPNEPGASYVIALSFGFRPGIPVAGGRKIYLNPDPLFHYSMTNSGIFSGFQGGLNPRGEAPASVAIPNLPGLSGLRFFASAVTIVNHRISVISGPVGVTIQ